VLVAILRRMSIGSSSTTRTPAHSAPRGRFDAVVELNRPICREHFLLRVRVDRQGPSFPPTEPGVFIQLGCRTPDRGVESEQIMGHDLMWSAQKPPQPGQLELCEALAFLRRPFSLAGRGEDERGTWLDVIHRVVGVGTAWLADLQVGDAVDLIGPLGNSFELPEDKSLGLLVGGGVGLPPMFYLAEAMKAAGWDAVAFVGAMSADLLAVTMDGQQPPDAQGTAVQSVEEFARHGYSTVLTTDDGSCGLEGRITVGLERVLEKLSADDAHRAVVFTCGPEPMMHATARLAEQYGIDCQVCMEQAMACGMGTCQSCVVRIEEHEAPHARTQTGRPWRYRLACTDGPVFSSTEVIW